MSNDRSNDYGERNRIAELLAEHEGRLRHIVALHMHPLLRQRVELGDVMQEVYLAAHARLEHWKKAEAVPPFIRLRTLALQTVADLHRRHLATQKRDVHREVALDCVCGGSASSDALSRWLVDSLTSPRSKVARDEMRQLVRGIVEDLSPTDREILALRHFEELSNAEAAEVLGLEQKAASARYIRALKRLREKTLEVTELRP